MKKKHWVRRFYLIALCTGLVTLVFPNVVFAQGGQDTPDYGMAINTMWVLLTGALVFFMQSGFAFLEAGSIRSKNTINTLLENFIDTAVTGVVFWATGFALMFGLGNDLFGTEYFFLRGIPETMYGIPTLAFFFFQFAFSAAASTITTGAMAERTDFKSDLVYSILMGALIYPIVGHWIWGGGWLGRLGFADFAGSTVVHSVGGWAGLVGTLMLGARLGKYTEKGVNPVVGHSMTVATLGTFILWLGWYGFNPGSTLAVVGEMAWGSSAMQSVALITVNTTLAGCAAACVAIFIAYLQSGSWQIPWALNGALAGLVAVTAPCAWISPLDSILIGAAAGVIVYLGVLLLDRLKIDDPVGAIPVHLFCGVWGTLSIGLFAVNPNGLGRSGLFYGGGLELLGIQAVGVVAVGGFVLASMSAIFFALKLVYGLRVPRKAEIIGLDVYQHGMANYPEASNAFSPPAALIGEDRAPLTRAEAQALRQGSSAIGD